jgi:predicted Zn-dependent protease
VTTDPLRFRGHWRGGASAAEMPVDVEREGDMLVIRGEEEIARVALAAIVADAPLPGVARLLALPDGAQIETDNHEDVAALFPPRNRIDATAFWLESSWPTALSAIPLIAGVAWLLVAVLMPLAADPVARLISPRIELAMGEQALATLDHTVLKASKLDPDTQDEVERQFREFIAGEPGEENYDLVFRSGALGPNAFALPGGIIVVTDDMVKLADNEGELMAVLAHEIGHLRGRHALRLVLQDSGVIVLVTALAGDAVSMTFLAAALPTALLQSHYSRQFEAEADDYAFAHLKRHGYSPQLFADMMRRLQQVSKSPDQEGGVLQYFSTHPLTQERIERAEAQK